MPTGESKATNDAGFVVGAYNIFFAVYHFMSLGGLSGLFLSHMVFLA